MKDRVKDILFRLSIFGLLFVVPMVNGCGPQPQPQQQPQTETEGTRVVSKIGSESVIQDVQAVHFHAKDEGIDFCVCFVRFKFNGHYYIAKDQHDGILFHAPDCDCQNGDTGSSLLSSPFGSSSSMFDW